MEFTLGEVGAAIGSMVAAIVGGAISLKKLRPSFARDDVSVAAAAADLQVIDRLRGETDRLAVQNKDLADSVNRLQLETVKISSENSKLHMEILALREENAELRRENAEIRREREELLTEMQELRSDLREMSDLVHKLTRKRPVCATCEHYAA